MITGGVVIEPYDRPGAPRLLLTVPEAAEALAISRSKLYELLAAGTVASLRIDGSRRVPVAALEAFIAARLKAA
jgi:excisionase family DNA binding protein